MDKEPPYTNVKPFVEKYICVDVETAGPHPGSYALLSIGACTIGEPRQTFYVELRPDRQLITPEALKVHNLTMEYLMENGLDPAEAMQCFKDWLDEVTPPGYKPVFVAFNAAFDWMFVNTYFLQYLKYNPFGYTALDIKAVYMGYRRIPWWETTRSAINAHYLPLKPLRHHALEDAIDQAEIFENILTDMQLAH